MSFQPSQEGKAVILVVLPCHEVVGVKFQYSSCHGDSSLSVFVRCQWQAMNPCLAAWVKTWGNDEALDLLGLRW